MNSIKLMFFVALVTLFVSSCDDGVVTPVTPTTPNNNANQTGVPGTWEMTGVDYSGHVISEVFGTVLDSSTLVGTGTTMNVVMTITENPNDITTTGSYDMDVDITSLGITQSTTWASQQFGSVGTWTEANNILSVTQGSTVTDMPILSVNATTLVLRQEFSVGQSSQGVTVTNNIVSDFTFTRK